MNKIYKVVWNTVRNCYVVGSELISSKSGRHSTSNGKSSSLKVTLTVLALCGMTALGSGVAPAYAADAGTAVASQYVAVLVNTDNNYYYTSRGRKVQYGDTRDFDGHSYHKETVSGETYWVRDGYSIKYEENERYPGAQKDNIIKAYKTSSYTAASDEGLLKSNQIMIESAGISTLTGVDLDNVSGGTYVGATNSGSTSTPSSFNYMIKDDNGTYVDAGNTNFSKRFKAATKNTDGTYSYNGEVIANDNLYVVNEQVGVFLTSSGKVYTGKVFGANNEVLMTTKSDEGTMYSYWGADTPDPNTKLADMTIGQFNQALEKVNNNSKAVAGDTIKEIKTTAKTDGGTIDLVRRGQYNSATGKYEGEYTVGDGITITSHGGTNGEDVKINFSNGTTGFDVAAGSKVSAIGTTDATTGLTINGVDYMIKAGKDYKAGENIQISADNTISANDNYVTGGNISNDTITLNRVQGGDVTITGLKDYVEGLDSYVTSASLKDNKLTITQNNGKGNYEIDLSGFANQFSGTDYRVVANPAEGSNGIYTPDASGNIELTVEDAKTGAKSTVQLSDIASATTVNNNYTTLDTKIDKTKTDITNAYTTTINETKTTITNEYQKYVRDNEDYVTSGSISNDTITLKRALGGEVTITGLKDYVEGLDSYVTSASLKDNKLTITQNNDKGNYVIDLSDFADQFSGTDYRVVANPAKDSGGIYKPDASGNIELTVEDTKTGAKSTVQLSDIASATTVNNNYTTLDTKIDKTKTDITNAYTTTINETKTTITNEYQKYVRDNEDYVTSGSISNDTITLKRALGGEVTITGLKDYVEGLDSYVTSASLKDNKLTITQNNGKGNYEIDLSGFANQFSGTDYRVVANPAEGSNGIYTPDASGNIELTVQDTKTGETVTVQLSDIASATTVTNNYNTLDTKIDNTRTDITNEYNTAIDNAKTEIQNDYNTKIEAAKTHYFSVNAFGEGNYNNDGAVGLGSIAVGANAYANGRIGASAFGNRAYADGERTLAVGYGAKAQGLAAIAIGTGSLHGADGTDAIAIGEQSDAKGDYTTAVGGYSQAVADGATAFGQQAVASGSHSTAIGMQSQALGNQSTAVGDYSKTEGTATVAFGGYSKTTGNFATALGYASKSVTRGTAVGAASSVTGETGTALGLLSTASANGSVALGAQSSADIDAGVTGYNPNAVEGEDLTSPTWTSTLGAVSVGAAATVDKDGNPVAQKTRQITNLAAGTEDTDAVNVAQLKKSRVELTDGTNTTVNSTNDETDGHVIYSVDVNTNGTINKGDTNIVTGDTVYNALKDVSWTAKVNGTDVKTVKKDGTLNFIDGDNISISNDNGDIKISTTGLASSGDLWTAQAGGTDVKAVNQKVNFVGSDHITVTGTDGQIQFEATGLADTDFNNITNNAVTKIQNIAKGEDVHIKADTYTVGNDGSVTMTYVDGNGNPVTGEAKITGIAKSDLSNITNEGNNVINNIAKEAVKVVGGMNTTVEPSTTTDGPVEYKVNFNEDVNLGDTIYLNGSDGSISAASGGAQLAFNNSGLTVSQAKDGLTNETRIDGATITVDGGAGNQTIINGSTAHIGSVLVNGGSGTATISGLTNQTTKYDGFANGSGRAATEEQLKEVDSKAAAAKTTVTKGKNITVDEAKAADGSSTYTVGLETDVVLGDNAIKLNGSDGSISAKSGGAQLAFNTSGLTVSQAKNGLTNETRIDGATITVDGGAGNQTIINGSTAHIGSVLVNGGSGTATISGLTNQTTKYDGFANGSGRAATEEQLKEVDSKAAAAKTTVTKGKNITVDEAKAADGSSTYTVGLATDVTLGDNAIKLNGSDGSISATSGTSSLNFNDKGLSLSNGKNSTVINGGTITVNGGDSVISGTQATFGKIKLNAESDSTITGLTNTTTKYNGFATAGRAATEEQLKEVAGQAGEAIETAGKGWNLTTNGKEASKTNIKPDGTVDFSSNNDNLLISNAGADLSFSLSDNLDLTKNDSKKGSVKVGENTTLTDGLLQVGTDVSLTASALRVGASSLTTDALMVGGLTYINSNGLNANNRVISNVAAGILDTDAVNVGQLKSAISGSQVSIKAGDGISVAKTGNQYTINVNIEGVTNNQGKVTVSTGDSTSTESGSESGSSGAKKFRVMDLMYRAESNEVAPETTTDTGKAIQIESIPEDIKLEADDNQAASVVNGETIKIAGDGTNISTTATVTGSGSKDTISVSLKPDIQVDSVTINNGGPTINNTGIDMNGKSITNVENITVNNGPTINSSGIDMNSQKITNLADGEIAEGSTDAVNGGQLYNTNQAVIANAENINSLSHSLNKLDSRINRVGAGAAALAALHPLDFDPDNKWDFAAGYGNYAGANAVAIGTYYRPNENTMFSIGGSFGGGENMINAGVSFKLGSGGSGITTSKTVMAKKIKEQDELLKAQDAKMKEQDEKIAKLEALVAQQGEMIQQALGKK